MRKVILLEHVSLDGFVAGPNGEMDWINFDEALEKDVHALHATTDAAIYGRVTFQMMESYWPTVLDDPTAAQGSMNHARWLDAAAKIVISRSLDHVDWKNTIVIKDNIAEEIRRIKQQPGKDLWLIGSPSIAHIFMQHDLIDEYRLNVNPVVLGRGMPLFADADVRLPLILLDAKTYQCGVTALRYEPDRK